jgi:hypothetical protein
MPPSSRVRSDRFANFEDKSTSVWFTRASHLVRAINTGCITIDEAAQELLAAVRCAAEVRALRRAAWDAGTVLGDDALLTNLLQTASQQIAVIRTRTS